LGDLDHPQYKVLHGWPLDGDGDYLTTMTYDPTARTVTVIALVGATFDVWVLGEKITVASPHVSAAHTATAGAWFYYHDGSAWVWSQTPWNMTRVSPTCYLYWSTVKDSGYALEERHRAERNAEWHSWAHNTFGTALRSGGTIGDYTLAADTDADIQFSIVETVVADEDIETTLAAKADGAGFSILRRSGTSGIWTWDTAQTLPFLYGTYPQRNYDAGGATGWTMADISGAAQGQFVAYYLLATPALDATLRFVLIPGQTAYASLAAAQAETINQLSIGVGFALSEACPLYQLVFQARSIFGGTAKAELVSVSRINDKRSSITADAGSFQHNSLQGLQGGTAGEYYHATAVEYASLRAVVSMSYFLSR
jgi:hypothetical protein